MTKKAAAGVSFGDIINTERNDRESDLEDTKDELLKAREARLTEANEENEENEEKKTLATEKPEKLTEAKDTEAKADKPVEQKTSDDDKQEAKPLTVDERIALMEKELELRDIQSQRRDADIDKWKTLAQTRQGELDYLRKSGNSRTSRSAEDDLDLLAESDNGTADDNGRTQNPLISELQTDAVQRAKESALQKFYQDFPDSAELAPEIAEYMKEHGEDYATELQSGSPKKVSKASSHLLREARLHVLETKKLSELEEARQRKLKVSEATRARKIQSQASDSGSSGSENLTNVNPLEDPRALEAMSTKDLAALLKRDKRRTGIAVL